MQENYPLQQVLERYDVRDINLLYRFTEMKEMDLNSSFILTLLKMFEEENHVPSEELNNYPLQVIVDYIQRTHRYYLLKKLPEMEQSIELMLADYSDNHPLLPVLRDFYIQYKNDLTKHIQLEEKYVLPHIKLLTEASDKNYDAAMFLSLSKNYSLRKFIESHTDTEGDLASVRETIKQYNPPLTNRTPYRVLLTQLQMFEKDLSVHAIIEDMVLIPRAIRLEDEVLAKQSSYLN